MITVLISLCLAAPSFSSTESELALTASPDGRATATLDGSTVVVSIDGETRRLPGEVREFSWTPQGDFLVLTRPTGEGVHLWAHPMQGGEELLLTPNLRGPARIHTLAPTHPHEVVIAQVNVGSSGEDLWKIDLRSGERTLVFDNPGYERVYLDDDLVPVLAEDIAADGTVTWYARRAFAWRAVSADQAAALADKHGVLRS